jgi:hypothetical protein
MAAEDSKARRFIFFNESERLLRKGGNASARRRLENEFREAARRDALLFGFECLTGPVSVFLHIHAPSTGQVPQIPPVAKAYLDALEGIAYEDDRQVEHLVVFQDSLRHPLMSENGEAVEVGREEDDLAAVFVEVEPLEDYTDRYDSAYRAKWFRRGASPWRQSFGVTDWKRLHELRWEQKRFPQAANVELLRQLEEEALRDGFLADLDRPGPLPEVTNRIHGVLPLPKLHRFLRARRGAMLVLPLRGHMPGSGDQWTTTLNGALETFSNTRKGLPFNGFVALDIAVRGVSLEGKDLDNLTHSILIPLEEKLCVRRGTVLGYRVYTAVGEPEGVQVRIIDHPKLLSLNVILHEIELNPPLLDRMEKWGMELEKQKAEAVPDSLLGN